MRGKKPVKEGDVITVEIVSIGKNGDGLAYIGDSKFVIFVERAKIGEKVKAKINAISKNSAFAEVYNGK